MKRGSAGGAPMPAAGCENNLRPRDLPRCFFSFLLRPLLYGTARALSTAPRSQPATARAARHAGRPPHPEGPAAHADAGLRSGFHSGRSFPISPLTKDARD